MNDTTYTVKFPMALVEESLKLAPKEFRLGGRRPDWGLDMNKGGCSLVADGQAVSVLDPKTGETHPPTFEDWLIATHLIDSIDEIGIYWNMVEISGGNHTPADFVSYWRKVLENCSKHIQDSTESIEKSTILLEILQIAFGGKETIRRLHPFSFLICPMSPLVIDERYTDAYLEIGGYDIPVAIMPMPLMGATGPASLISNLLLANCETLAMLCLVQAADPGTPVIYAPTPQTVEPHTWRYTGGAIEHALFGAAVTEMGRYYGLPVEASTGGTDQYCPGTQASYERTINWSLPALACPDLLVGPGLLGGSTLLCVEQLVLDLEIFRRHSYLARGFDSQPGQWLDEDIHETGSDGNFLKRRSTREAIRQGNWYMSRIGYHDTYEKWKLEGMPDVLDSLQDIVKSILKEYRPLPLDENTERELVRLERKLEEGLSIRSRI